MPIGVRPPRLLILRCLRIWSNGKDSGDPAYVGSSPTPKQSTSALAYVVCTSVSRRERRTIDTDCWAVPATK